MATNRPAAVEELLQNPTFFLQRTCSLSSSNITIATTIDSGSTNNDEGGFFSGDGEKHDREMEKTKKNFNKDTTVTALTKRRTEVEGSTVARRTRKWWWLRFRGRR
ncbi:hypothetical protein PIB30_036833 [Stylosanthes scabra]|uniref:Uncharacterized protein n=1 Tax=Stylosanthes scabra TaxID=79078 RepID=A0ABU6RDN5_9FABA|nr:hypothetical protein [Stylosanthes scabra]